MLDIDTSKDDEEDSDDGEEKETEGDGDEDEEKALATFSTVEGRHAQGLPGAPLHCHHLARGHFLNMPFGAIFLDKTLPLPQLVPDGAGKEEEGGEPPRLKLECVASWRLFGWVQSIASVRLAGADRDSLLLAFKNTKLSLVVYFILIILINIILIL